MSQVIAYSYYTLNLSPSLPTRPDRLRHNSDDLDGKKWKKTSSCITCEFFVRYSVPTAARTASRCEQLVTSNRTDNDDNDSLPR